MTAFGTKTTSSDPSGWPKDLCADSSLVLPVTQAPVSYKVCSDDPSQACELDSDCGGGTCDVSLYDYGSLAEFRKRVDNSMAGLMRDCAECHVGGGAHEHIIAPIGTDLQYDILDQASDPRLKLRNFDNSALDTGKFNAYNYFIDQFDENKDGSIGEVLPQNYDVTGVLEVDCFMCHLTGYDWKARKDAIRTGKFDASRAAGAGFIIITPDNVCSDDTSVTCDPANGDADCMLPGYCQNAPPVSCSDDSQCWADFGGGPVFLGPCAFDDLGTCLSREPIIDGTNVTYDSADDGSAPILENTVFGYLEIGPDPFSRIEETPPGKNCASCHFAEFQADWKKRGASWPTDAYMASLGEDARKLEVHRYVGLTCIDCHAPYDAGTLDGNLMNEKGSPLAPVLNPWTGIAMGPGDDTLGHDVAKAVVPYGTLWNAQDNTMFTCRRCHLDQIYPSKLDTNGTPPANPNATGGAHERYGLLHNYLQDGRDGVADASHVDVLACDVCHTRKFGTGVDTVPEPDQKYGTGGAISDGTGVDADGRTFDYQNSYVQRLMEDNLVRAWQGDMLTIKHAMVTIFWRDVDENPANPDDATKVDINADGQSGFMDPVQSIQVAAAMARGVSGLCSGDGTTECWSDADCSVAGGTCTGNTGPLEALTTDGDISSGEIDTQRQALEQYLDDVGINLDPATTGTNQQELRLSFMGMLFRSNHGTSPKEYAWGHGGCLDCHQDGAGFYNGAYELKGDDLTLSWNNTGDQYVVPFTSVNQGDLTDFDPLLMPKGLTGRTIAIQVASGTINTLRAVDRSEFMYETDSTVAGGPGPRTMVSGAVLGTRTEIVNHLNNALEITFPNFDFDLHQTFLTIADSCLDCHVDMITFEFGWGGGSFESQGLFNAGQHTTHFRIKNSDDSNALTCTDCHDSTDFSIKTTITVTADLILKNTGTTDTDTFNPVPTMTNEGCNKWAVDNADGITGTADDFTCLEVINPVETGRYTCATACHPSTAQVIPPEQNQATSKDTTGTEVIVAYAGAIHSMNDNNTITLDAGTRSQCTGTCSYVWNLSPECNFVSAAPDNSVIVVDGTAGETCTASVDVTNDAPAETVNSGDVALVFNGLIEAVGPATTYTLDETALGSGVCDLGITAADTAVAAVVYWGNRESSHYNANTDPSFADLVASGDSHDCVVGSVKINVYDAHHTGTVLQ